MLIYITVYGINKTDDRFEVWVVIQYFIYLFCFFLYAIKFHLIFHLLSWELLHQFIIFWIVAYFLE